MIKKNIFIILGVISLIFGTVGIIIPLLPTTPFYLLSAYFFSKSSEKFHKFLLNNKVCGGYIRDYHERKGITLKNKINALVLLILSIGVSILRIKNLHLQIFLGLVFICVSFHILKIRTLR